MKQAGLLAIDGPFKPLKAYGTKEPKVSYLLQEQREIY